MSVRVLVIDLLNFLFEDVLVSAATCVDGTKVTNAKCCAVVPVVKDLQKNFFGSNEVCPSLVSLLLQLPRRRVDDKTFVRRGVYYDWPFMMQLGFPAPQMSGEARMVQ